MFTFATLGMDSSELCQRSDSLIVQPGSTKLSDSSGPSLTTVSSVTSSSTGAATGGATSTTDTPGAPKGDLENLLSWQPSQRWGTKWKDKIMWFSWFWLAWHKVLDSWTLTTMGTVESLILVREHCGQVDRELDSRSEGLGFDSQCWPCVEVLGKLCIQHRLGPPTCNGYLVHRSKVGSIVAGCIGAYLARGKVESVEHVSSWSLDSKTTTFTFSKHVSSQIGYISYVWSFNFLYAMCDFLYGTSCKIHFVTFHFHKWSITCKVKV